MTCVRRANASSKCMVATKTSTPGHVESEIPELHPILKAPFSLGSSAVYPQSVYTNEPKQAATFFHIVVQDVPNALYVDLAKGAGGVYRYLVPVRHARQKRKIVGAILYHTTDGLNAPKLSALVKSLGYNGSTTNINEGKGGDCLYLLWKSIWCPT